MIETVNSTSFLLDFLVISCSSSYISFLLTVKMILRATYRIGRGCLIEGGESARVGVAPYAQKKQDKLRRKEGSEGKEDILLSCHCSSFTVRG